MCDSNSSKKRLLTDQGHDVWHEKHNQKETLGWKIGSNMDSVECTRHDEKRNHNLKTEFPKKTRQKKLTNCGLYEMLRGASQSNWHPDSHYSWWVLRQDRRVRVWDRCFPPETNEIKITVSRVQCYNVNIIYNKWMAKQNQSALTFHNNNDPMRNGLKTVTKQRIEWMSKLLMLAMFPVPKNADTRKKI